jgi:hypothetical protein
MYGPKLRRQLDELVAHWEEVALPTEGRYICQPAIANHTGTVAVPPPVLDKQLLVFAAVAGISLLGMCLLRQSFRHSDEES